MTTFYTIKDSTIQDIVDALKYQYSTLSASDITVQGFSIADAIRAITIPDQVQLAKWKEWGYCNMLLSIESSAYTTYSLSLSTLTILTPYTLANIGAMSKLTIKNCPTICNRAIVNMPDLVHVSFPDTGVYQGMVLGVPVETDDSYSATLRSVIYGSSYFYSGVCAYGANMSKLGYLELGDRSSNFAINFYGSYPTNKAGHIMLGYLTHLQAVLMHNVSTFYGYPYMSYGICSSVIIDNKANLPVLAGSNALNPICNYLCGFGSVRASSTFTGHIYMRAGLRSLISITTGWSYMSYAVNTSTATLSTGISRIDNNESVTLPDGTVLSPDDYFNNKSYKLIFLTDEEMEYMIQDFYKKQAAWAAQYGVEID